MSLLRAVRLPVVVTVVGVAVFLAVTPAHSAQGPVGLGTADSFAVLAGAGITNTGPTTITGDVGTFPTTSQSGFGSVTLHGTNHGGDAVTRGAKDDLVAAYGDAAGRTPATDRAVELGGSTLLPGVYRSPTFGLTGTLTLDAEGVSNAQFIFQTESTVIAETNSRVRLLNGALPCNVVWQVGSSATFKVGTRFVGDVLALTSITAQTNATFVGRLLARNGAVTLDTNTITRSSCTTGATPTPAPSASVTPGPTATVVPATTTPGSSSGTPVLIPAAAPAAPTGSLAGPPRDAAGAPPRNTAGAPPRETVNTPLTPPFLPVTGRPEVALALTGVALLAIGTASVLAGRRGRGSQVA